MIKMVMMILKAVTINMAKMMMAIMMMLIWLALTKMVARRMRNDVYDDENYENVDW
jgi:hypothetical protein